MAHKDQFLTTGEFASKTGMPVATVTKFIRAGKIVAQKKSGKWLISPDQLKSQILKDSSKPVKKSTGQKSVKTAKKNSAVEKPAAARKDKSGQANAVGGRMFTVAEFADMTYLTEWGVVEWLKQGRLNGQQLDGGEWKVDAANLERSDVKRLVRG